MITTKILMTHAIYADFSVTQIVYCATILVINACNAMPRLALIIIIVYLPVGMAQ